MARSGTITWFDRVLPWTRMMRPGPVTLEDGSTVDLMEYALANPGELMLKPALLVPAATHLAAAADVGDREHEPALEQIQP